MKIFDLNKNSLRTLHTKLHDQKTVKQQKSWQIINPKGSHALAVGLI